MNNRKKLKLGALIEGVGFNYMGMPSTQTQVRRK